MKIDRRGALASAGTGLGAGLLAGAGHAAAPAYFPRRFLWGAAGAGHQVEGNNSNSDVWLLEQVKPTMFATPSGDADRSFDLWPADLAMVREAGLNAFRFSLEWARIEPEPGQFSLPMLDHYKAMIEACRAQSIAPVVTFNHFTVPRWFGAMGGWTHSDSPQYFARFCDRAARHLATRISHATTLNEPNTVNILGVVFPPPFLGALRSMNAAAAKACSVRRFSNAMVPDPADIGTVQPNLLAAHRQGKAAIKAVRGDLPVGVSLAISDDQAAGSDTGLRDARREEFYGAWLEAARDDDFLGVQNYERAIWGEGPAKTPPPGATLNAMGREVYPQSLAHAVRYAHSVARVPILVTEHGVPTDDDAIRAGFIRDSLAHLHEAIAAGVPVAGYIHWSLLDSFEWIFGYKPHYGLCAVDRTSFERKPKPSLGVLGAIARANAI